MTRDRLRFADLEAPVTLGLLALPSLLAANWSGKSGGEYVLAFASLYLALVCTLISMAPDIMKNGARYRVHGAALLTIGTCLALLAGLNSYFTGQLTSILDGQWPSDDYMGLGFLGWGLLGLGLMLTGLFRVGILTKKNLRNPKKLEPPAQIVDTSSQLKDILGTVGTLGGLAFGIIFGYFASP